MSAWLADHDTWRGVIFGLVSGRLCQAVISLGDDTWQRSWAGWGLICLSLICVYWLGRGAPTDDA